MQKGYSLETIQAVYERIKGRESYSVLGVKDLRYLVRIGYNEKHLLDSECKNAIKKGIEILTEEGYLHIEESSFNAVFVSGKGKQVSYNQLLEYMNGDEEVRRRMEDEFKDVADI